MKTPLAVGGRLFWSVLVLIMFGPAWAGQAGPVTFWVESTFPGVGSGTFTLDLPNAWPDPALPDVFVPATFVSSSGAKTNPGLKWTGVTFEATDWLVQLMFEVEQAGQPVGAISAGFGGTAYFPIPMGSPAEAWNQALPFWAPLGLSIVATPDRQSTSGLLFLGLCLLGVVYRSTRTPSRARTS